MLPSQLAALSRVNLVDGRTLSILEFCEHWAGPLTSNQQKFIRHNEGISLFVGVGRKPGLLKYYPVIQRDWTSDLYLVINNNGDLEVASNEGIILFEKKHSSLPTESKNMPLKKMTNSGDSVLTQYIKKGKNNKKVGMFFATKQSYESGSRIIIGHSLCNPKDTFSRTQALKIAKGRAFSLNQQILPNSLEHDFKNFHLRCKKFFKNSICFNNYNGYTF